MQAKKEKVLDNDRLLRRVPFLHPNYIKPDGSLTSFSFSLKPTEDGLSVDIERLTTYERSILDIARFRLYALRCDFVRQQGLDCVHDPLEDNVAHALIVGKIKKSLSRNLARNAVRIGFPKE